MLWKKVAPKLSAGRVQSVATRIIVQRERDRMAFRSASYWDIIAELDASLSDPNAQPPRFTARLVTVDGKRVAAGRDFDSLGVLRKPDEVLVLDEASAGTLATGLRGAELTVASVEEKPYTRRPYPPFMTSTSAAGGGPQAAVHLGADDERRSAAVRERPHHLYAYRLDDAVAVGHRRRAQPGGASSTARSTSTRPRASTPAR